GDMGTTGEMGATGDAYQGEAPTQYDTDVYIDPADPAYVDPADPTYTDPAFTTGQTTDDASRPNTLTPFGMSATGGGGVTGFTDEEARDFSEVGGGWDARFVLGTRTPVAGEVAYLGSSRSVSALGLDDSAF